MLFSLCIQTSVQALMASIWGLNITNISLIPKGSTQVSMKDWRPITLCNVLYKIISKVLANRLKKVLPKCISDNQSAFVSGRSILDNAMVAIEVLHFMKAKTRGEDKYVALKLDISKAYDRMDWNYLRAVLNKMGFHNRWIHWMCMCVESVDYSVLVNGTQVGPIIPWWGLRQGDPLSLHTCLLFVQKVYLRLSEMPRQELSSRVQRFVVKHR